MSDQGGFQFTPQNEDAGQGTGNADDIVSPFLSKIPEADREVVGRYVQDWDRGVQDRFSKIHETYAPWKEFDGVDPQQIREALQTHLLLNTNPQRVYELLTEVGQAQGWEGFEKPQPQPWEDSLPPEFLDRFNQMDKVLQALGQDAVESRQARQQAEEDAQLNAYMDHLQKKHGSFDADYVIAKMSAGMDGDKAVQEYQKLVEQVRGGSNGNRPAPKVLSGAGSVGVERGIDYTKANVKSTDVQAYLIDRLRQAHSEG